MPFTPAMAAGLGCPRCTGGTLDLVANSLRCRGCETRYPFVATIPCLVPDPPLWHAQWLNRLGEFVSDTQATLAGWRADAEQCPPRTRARIDRVIAACEDQRARVEVLFEDMRQGQLPLLPTRPEPRANPLLEFSENLFRDWVWGDKETKLTHVAGREPRGPAARAVGRLRRRHRSAGAGPTPVAGARPDLGPRPESLAGAGRRAADPGGDRDPARVSRRAAQRPGHRDPARSALPGGRARGVHVRLRGRPAAPRSRRPRWIPC